MIQTLAPAAVRGLVVAVHAAAAPIEPEAIYAAPGSPIRVLIQLDEGADARLDLIALGVEPAIASAPVVAGPADLATLFPEAWGELERGTRFAQLTIEGRPIGPALVLQPLARPRQARIDPATGRARFDAAAGPISGVRLYVDREVVLETSSGEITIRLRPDLAPNTSWNFRRLVEDGFYDGTPFHRVVSTPAARFVIQGGDPTGTGSGGPGYQIDLEPSSLAHDFGVVSMARGNEPDTAGSQFFIGLSREATRPLDGQYAAFGQVVSGADAILSIAGVPTVNEKPEGEMPRVIRARLVEAPPVTERPAPAQAPSSAGQPR